MKWLELSIVKETAQALYDMWSIGWNERNSGNISVRLTPEQYKEATDLDYKSPWNKLPYDIPEVGGDCFLVSKGGSYFRNAISNTKSVLGIIELDEKGSSWRLLCGYDESDNKKGIPTSELPAHLMCHNVRKRVSNDKDRVVVHAHATNLTAVTGSGDYDEASLSYALWNACTESVVIFPRGIGILEWMMPGSLEIGIETSKKMEDFTLVLWSGHGVYGTGENVESTFGLIETAETSALVLIKMLCLGGQKKMIGSKNLGDIAKLFGVNLRKDFLK